MENTTREQLKSIAVKRLQQLNIFKPYIKAFKEKNIITYFENFGGFWATAENGAGDLENIIKEFENNHAAVVYAATHNYTECGEMYALLYVNEYDLLNYAPLHCSDGVFYPFAYVHNVDCPDFSEFGGVGVQSMGGGLRRCY